MALDEMVLPVCNQVYSIVRQAVVSSLLVDHVFCSLLSNGPSLSLHLALCQFSSVSVDICCNVDISTNVNWNEVLTYIIDGMQWWGLSTR